MGNVWLDFAELLDRLLNNEIASSEPIRCCVCGKSEGWATRGAYCASCYQPCHVRCAPMRTALPPGFTSPLCRRCGKSTASLYRYCGTCHSFPLGCNIYSADGRKVVALVCCPDCLNGDD